MRVIATKDLWTDGGDRLLVLSGTLGTVIGREKGEKGWSPSCFIVSFADGQTTFCTADEICEFN